MSKTFPHILHLPGLTGDSLNHREISESVSALRSLILSYERIRSLSRSQASPELTQARSELDSHVQGLSADLRDLVDSVKVVEGDPFKYGLDTAEVGRRRELVQERSREVEDVVRELRTSVAHDATTPGSQLPPPSSFDPDSPETGDDYAAFEQQRQVEIMQEQDDALDDVSRTVGNLKQQADDMGREFEEQDEMLEEVGNIGDRLDGKLKQGMKKVEYVIRKNEGIRFDCRRHYARMRLTGILDMMSSCCIGILIFALILLLILVLVL